MFSDYAIRCDSVAKSFRIFSNYNDRLWQVIFGRYRKFYRDYQVLEDISFDVRRGECVGIIGRNGAGKTTLLQLICGISQPSRGSIATSGRIAPILALGAAFDADLTGRENAMVGGAILGLSRKDVERRLSSIANFAAIGDFFDRQIKFYSSGMIARLAFSICAHADAEILVVDEALAVGDEAFRDKCLNFLSGFRSKGTILFVSHNLAQVALLCDRVIWVDGGRIRAIGEAPTVIEQYKEALAKESDDFSRFRIGTAQKQSAGGKADDPKARLSRLAQRARAEIESSILPFWLALEDRQYGSHYAKMDSEGRLDRTGERSAVFVGRILWTLSEAYRILGNTECVAQAGRTKKFLVERMLDPVNGGVRWLVDHRGEPLADNRRLYAQSFAIYGLSNYYRASGDIEARDISISLFELLETRTRIGPEGSYCEEFDSAWAPLGKPYSLNGHLHLMEAYSELFVATGNAAVRKSLADLLVLLLNRFVSAKDHTFPQLDDQLVPISSPVSFGHDIETSWMLDEVAERLGDPKLMTRARATASRLARAAIRDAMQPDGSWLDSGGAGVPSEWRIWWVQAEALRGVLNEALRSSEPPDVNLIVKAELIWQFIETWQTDPKGDWFNEVAPDGKVNPLKQKVSIWKEPYHQSRSCLWLIEQAGKSR